MKSLVFLVFSALLAISAFTTAQDNEHYVVPRTEYGQPDFQGVWNFSSNIPLQRPQEFADQQVLNSEEITSIQEKKVAAFEAGVAGQPGVGIYNTFWFEQAGRGDNLRTSLITYPENGRIPEAAEGAQKQDPGFGDDIAGSRPVRFMVGGISKDGPEDRGLSERCIVGFNAGPPFIPSAYNNNVQLFQSKDYVVILTEMIHDAWIIPLDGRPLIDDTIRQCSGDSRGCWGELPW